MAFKKILIIEDNQKHLEEVKNFIDERKKAGADFEAHFVSTFEEAKKALDTEQYDGIISDIFFPDRAGAPAEPTTPAPLTRYSDEKEILKWAEGVGGVKLVREAQARRIPFILCTSTYHHGEKTQPVTTWIRENSADFIVDASHKVGGGEAEHKDWQSAFIELAYIRSQLDHRRRGFSERGAVQAISLRDLFPEEKLGEILPLSDVSRAESYASAPSEVSYGKKKGKMHTMDPILMEVLNGPGRGLVPYTSEEPTTAELLERVKEQEWFREDPRSGLGVRSYNDEEERECTEAEIEERTRQAVERFITKWREQRPKVEQAWQELLKLNKGGIEGIETELPSMRPKDWGERL